MLERLNRLIKGYTPTFWLPFSIMKTFYQGDQKISDMGIYSRRMYEMDDGEVIAVDFYPLDHETMPETAPTVMFIPGVFGMSRDKYSAKLCTMFKEQLGWRTCVFNRRGYGGMPIKGTRVIGLNSYDDIHSVIKQLAAQFPLSNIYLVGASMGAVNTQNYLACFGEENLVKGAVTISSPWNAHIVTDRVAKNPLLRKGVHGYQLKLFKEQLKNDSFNKLLENYKICKDKVLGTKNNQEFDDIFSAAGLGLESKEAYYDQLSCHTKISRIRVPVLSMNTNDDILIPVSVIPFEELESNPYFIHLQVSGGGHTEYFHGCRAAYVRFYYSVGVHVCHRISSQFRGFVSRKQFFVKCLPELDKTRRDQRCQLRRATLFFKE